MIFSVPSNKGYLYYYYRYLCDSLAGLPPLEGVALLPVDADSFAPQSPEDRSEINIGVYLPDNGLITPACMNTDFPWNLIVVPSQWLEYQLRIRGITSVITIRPGYETVPIDVDLKHLHADKFVVASGGKLALHNGHDLILCAMRQFMADHVDCWFACNWILESNNLSQLHLSPHCTMDGCVPWDLDGLLAKNGIDPARTLHPIHVSATETSWDFAACADMYLSPARVLVGDDPDLAAFGATGKPVITFEPLDGSPQLAPDGTTAWFEPAVTDILERLEIAYANWKSGSHVAFPAADIRSWATAASQMYSAITERFGIHARPASVFTWNKRGVALASLDLYDASLENFRKALTLEPFNPETYNCLGNLMAKQERHQEALLYFDKAILLDINFAAAFFNKASTLKDLKLYEESIAAYQKALQIDPFFATGWLNLAITYALDEQEDKAEHCFLETLIIDPGNTDALFLWGNQLLGQRAWERAIDCYEQILKLDPQHYLACNSMGIAWLSLMEAKKAYAVLRKALVIKPDMDSAMANIGTACRDMGLQDEARSWYERSLSIDTENADNHWNYSLILLHMGNYEKGWREYEWRFKKSEKLPIRDCSLPLWDGESNTIKSVLIQAEQGYGDTIQFMRYIPLVSSIVETVIVECQDDAIKPLVKLVSGSAKVVSCLEQQPAADAKIAMLSLPRIFNTTVETIPFSEGYISPPSDQISRWNAMLSKAKTKSSALKVGFVWDGRKTFRNVDRSIPLDVLMPLFEQEDIAFVSLQKGEQSQQLKSLTERYNIIDLTDNLTNFLDTASLIANLDLVISIDTSVAHLAGAVGCPTWIMLKVGPDWRWLENRQDSPWYDSVRLFPQETSGVWDDVVERVCHELVEFKKLRNTSKVCPL